MIYVVLSLGKSGSSLLASILHHNGIRAFEDSSIGADTCGRYEDEKVCEVNRDYFYPHHQSLNMHYPVVAEASIGLQNRMRTVIRNGAAMYSDYCIKDPRMSYTYHLWEPLLPEHKLIIQFRHPCEVIQHYYRSKEQPLVPKNIADRYIHVYLKAIEHSKHRESLFISYESLRNPNTDKLSKFVGKEIVNKYISTRRYTCRDRERFARDDIIALYNRLKELESV